MVVLPPAVGHAEEDDRIWDAVHKISQLYEKLEYEQAFTLIQGARRLPRGVEGEVTLSLYEGIILYEMGLQEPSRAAFREALQMRPGADLPEDVAPKVQHFFEAVQLESAREKAVLPASRKPAPEAHPSAQEEEEDEEDEDQDAAVQADTDEQDGVVPVEASETRTVAALPKARTPASVEPAEPPVSASPMDASPRPQTREDPSVE
ncbi:hypothetical protein [Cystobacter fuscus]|uniref:hypothetical protein n=1 Tax=Cystobacter fuscus TaxID=43 RepID=UPI002B286EF2|nr:hypothetical protein F0U63_01745 [Cystobacter fuscus]